MKLKYVLFFITIAAFLFMPTSVMAWGPERPTYTNEAPADHATFNSITNNAAVGDERDFVRIEEKNSGRPYSSEIMLEAGKQYEVYIYYHNDASETYNDAAHHYAGVSRNTRVTTNFPDELAAGKRGQISAIIRSDNASPQEVWDEAYITAKEDMTLHFVTGSAKLQNDWDANGSMMPRAIFDDEGAFLGVNELNGVILGCDRYSGQVVYTIQTEAVASSETGFYRNISIILAAFLLICLAIIVYLVHRKRRI